MDIGKTPYVTGGPPGQCAHEAAGESGEGRNYFLPLPASGAKTLSAD